MIIKLKSVPNSQLEEIRSYFSDHESIAVISFELEKLHGLLEAVPELKKRPWLFDASDDIIEAEARYIVTTDKTELWFSFNDLKKNEIVTKLDDDQMKCLIDDCGFATLNHGCLEIDNCVGRDYSGEEIWETSNVTVYDWVEAFGQNRKDLQKLFSAWLLRFGGEWLNELEK